MFLSYSLVKRSLAVMRTRKTVTRYVSAGIFGVAGTILLTANIAFAQSTSTNLTMTQKQHLQDIINKGNQEIGRRLNSLNKLESKISAASKLTASDKAYLSAEISGEITGLTTLKGKLDAETTLVAARSDAQSIYTEYRVYYLVVPKVWLVKTADDQLIVESKLATLAQKLQTRIDSAKTSGKNVDNLQNELNDLTKQVSNAQSISSSIEQKVLPLQPSDYNSDHTILSGDRDQLKSAHTDNMAAYSDAKNIVNSLKNL